MAMVCCRVCKSTPIIFISASFVPSNLWLEHQHFTRLVVRPTSLCHQTERFLIFFEKTRFETQGQTERFLIFFEKTRFGHNDWKLRDRRNVFSYFLKRLVLVIMIGDFQNRETSRLSRLSRLSKRAGGQAFRGASPVRRGRNGGCPHEHVVLASDHAAYRL